MNSNQNIFNEQLKKNNNVKNNENEISDDSLFVNKKNIKSIKNKHLENTFLNDPDENLEDENTDLQLNNFEDTLLNSFDFKRQKEKLTCKTIFYKIFFKLDDIKFYYEVEYKDKIIEFYQKNKLQILIITELIITTLLIFAIYLTIY